MTRSPWVGAIRSVTKAATSGHSHLFQMWAHFKLGKARWLQDGMKADV